MTVKQVKKLVLAEYVLHLVSTNNQEGVRMAIDDFIDAYMDIENKIHKLFPNFIVRPSKK